MQRSPAQLAIIGDVGVDLVIGPIAEWPRVGTESLMDRNELRAGGSGANSALAVSYLGGESRLISAVGDDDLGAWLSTQLQSLRPSLATCNAATSVSVGFIHTCGERTFCTTRGHLEKLAYEHVRPQLGTATSAYSVVLLSGVFLTPALRTSYPRLIEDLGALGHQIALDTGWPPNDWDEPVRAEVRGWLAKCDHVLLNELEVIGLADEEHLETASREVAAWMKAGATLVVKAGGRGAIGYEGGERIRHEIVPSAVFDTVGAGDSFNAGYLLRRLEGGSLGESLEAGCRAATSIIKRFPRRQIRPGELAEGCATRPAVAFEPA